MKKNLKNELVLKLPGTKLDGIELLYNNMKDSKGGFFSQNKNFGKRVESDFIPLLKKNRVESVTLDKDKGHGAIIDITYEELKKFVLYVEKRIKTCSKIENKIKRSKDKNGLAISHLSPDVCFFIRYKLK